MGKSNKSFWMTPQGLVALLFISFPTYLLFIEHREHIFQFLPYLILLLCPLMHIFMHGGHGHHHSTDHDSSHDSFKEETNKNEAYRDGYIEGLKAGREERTDKEKDNAR
ncbi:DUF2933 domain-containing protein [Pseudomaricurvus alkylphenolicus]|uniref:DUF2933 domain-containing protein n=1 Tax=Pseudomaricurvus alkylphenolicus TaxID=1306991 RepID=UPI00141EDE44|nr:DUF2933 domain-containing protein [Pseudomaricurvus alkylphenolicus]NIB39736.1 DUF2933 domain-containing protein [Pseudomaricurvus alkylphenolicus]